MAKTSIKNKKSLPNFAVTSVFWMWNVNTLYFTKSKERRESRRKQARILHSYLLRHPSFSSAPSPATGRKTKGETELKNKSLSVPTVSTGWNDYRVKHLGIKEHRNTRTVGGWQQQDIFLLNVWLGRHIQGQIYFLYTVKVKMIKHYMTFLLLHLLHVSLQLLLLLYQSTVTHPAPLFLLLSSLFRQKPGTRVLLLFVVYICWNMNSGECVKCWLVLWKIISFWGQSLKFWKPSKKKLALCGKRIY